MGAPRKNPPNDAGEVIERLAASGFGMVGIARHLKVSLPTFKRWIVDDEAIAEAFVAGKETERQRLHAAIYMAAIEGKAQANSNAMFLLKCRHGYREFDALPIKGKTIEGDAQTTNVMIVVNHGSDEQWAAKVAEQQAALMAGCSSPLPIPMQTNLPSSINEDRMLEASNQAIETVTASPMVPSWEAPFWHPKR